jgi:hypothetical protein
MRSIFDGAGYFFNDDRASGGKFVEDDLVGCAHCPKPTKKAQWKLQGGMCFVCSKPMCAECTARALKFGCEGPEEKRIERAVNDLHRREQNAKVLGI